jgi:hypothetical protein
MADVRAGCKFQYISWYDADMKYELLPSQKKAIHDLIDGGEEKVSGTNAINLSDDDL